MKHYVQALARILQKNGALRPKDAQALVRDFKGTEPAQLHYFLLDEGLVSKEELLKALSEYFKVPYCDVRGYQFNHELLALFPQDFLVARAIIPLELDENIITVVAGDPSLPNLREDVGEYTTNHIEFMVGITRDIVDEARAYYENPPEETGEEPTPEEEVEEDTQDIVDLF